MLYSRKLPDPGLYGRVSEVNRVASTGWDFQVAGDIRMRFIQTALAFIRIKTLGTTGFRISGAVGPIGWIGAFTDALCTAQGENPNGIVIPGGLCNMCGLRASRGDDSH